MRCEDLPSPRSGVRDQHLTGRCGEAVDRRETRADEMVMLLPLLLTHAVSIPSERATDS